MGPTPTCQGTRGVNTTAIGFCTQADVEGNFCHVAAKQTRQVHVEVNIVAKREEDVARTFVGVFTTGKASASEGTLALVPVHLTHPPTHPIQPIQPPIVLIPHPPPR
ncbi:hypothetical protein L6452_02943 [Arctium lappa]|uniref:Uncharacterized protein n=1 Tax=Arctium lappa TaxID=4217 RepID=A0ACB9FLU3_ARCLA|nr:hypothetical protein L6452_02943 [Arctium lappa]